jgi:hypothetical protein
MTGRTTNGDDGQSGPADGFTYDIDPDESPSEAVVRAVAALTDARPLDLEPLYDAVDPDHLDGLFGRAGDDTARTEHSITFTYGGREITVTRETVFVRDTDGETR